MNQAERNTKIARLREQMTKAWEDINMKNARIATVQAQITAETERLKAEAWRINLDQGASEAVHRRRHQSRMPLTYEPLRLFNSLAAGTNTGAPVIPN